MNREFIETNDIILKISFAITEDMHQNVIVFHAANGMPQ
jgi:hypothetical protein